MSKINNNKDANVKLTYSSITGRFVLESKDTGVESKLLLEDGNDFLGLLGIQDSGEVEGKNAIIKVNVNGEKNEFGEDLKYHEVISTTNTFAKDGINFSLLDTTVGEENTTIRITEDIDASFDKIKSFIDKYNEL